MFYLAPSCPESADHTPSLTGTFPGPLSHSCVFFTFTDSNIRQAVEEWIDNPDDALAIYGDIATWDTRHVTNMDRLFYNRAEFNDDISNWNVDKVSSFIGIFDGASAFNHFIHLWNVKVLTDSNIHLAVRGWIGNPDDAFTMYGNITKWITSQVTRMHRLFSNWATFNDDISGWDVATVSSMKGMFNGASAFNQDISGWNVSSVRNARFMFDRAFSFNQDLCTWGSNLQKSDSNVHGMFNLASSCPVSATYTPSLTGTFPGPFCHSCTFFTFTDSNIRQAVEEWIGNPDDALAKYGDIATWDTRHVTNMDRMFYNRAPNSTITSLGGTSIRSPA